MPLKDLLLLSFLLLSSNPSRVGALRFPVEGREWNISAPHVSRRSAKIIDVFTTPEQRTAYSSKIIMGGKEFEVMMDTGSADLWMQVPIPNAKETAYRSGVQYGIGSIEGPIQVAQTTFAGFTVQEQAFIAAPPGSGQSTHTMADGLIGLGPSAGSMILQDSGGGGVPFLDNVFAQDTSSPNIMTIMLSRDGDTGKKVHGEFTIGEVAPELSAILTQPKLPVYSPPPNLAPDQHWTTIIDAIIGPNGQPINTISHVSGLKPKAMMAVFDSGFTYPQVPPYLSNAIYRQVPGAQFDQEDNFWLVPCKAEINLVFVIGGQKFPIHPWDVVMATEDALPPGLCLGAFQPMMASVQDPTYDIILGMAFLRNAYMLVNFGDFVQGNPEQQANPYMQLLSVTDPTDAHNDFAQSRLSSNAPSSPQNNPNAQGGSLGVSGDDDDNTIEKAKSTVKRNWPYFLAGGIALLAIIIGIFALICVRSKRRKSRKQHKKGMFQVSKPYQPLYDPAPAPAIEVHQPLTHSTHDGYSDPYYRT